MSQFIYLLYIILYPCYNNYFICVVHKLGTLARCYNKEFINIYRNKYNKTPLSRTRRGKQITYSSCIITYNSFFHSNLENVPLTIGKY